MIDEKDLEHLKLVFVTRESCDQTTEEINKKLANDSTALALINQQLSTITWVSKTTLAAVIAVIVGAILSLILR